MTPIRIELLIVMRLARWGTSMCVNSDVVTAEQRTSHPAVVTPRVSLIDSNNNESMF
jgi:hypothetical protein